MTFIEFAVNAVYINDLFDSIFFLRRKTSGPRREKLYTCTGWPAPADRIIVVWYNMHNNNILYALSCYTCMNK